MQNLNDLEQEVVSHFEDGLPFKYQPVFAENSSVEIAANRIQQGLDEQLEADPVYFLWLQDLAFLHLDYAIYMQKAKLDTDSFYDHFSRAASYSSVILHQGSQCCAFSRLGFRAPFITMNKAVAMFSTLILSQQWEKADQAMGHLIASLNGEECIIKNGNVKNIVSWFVVLLCAEIENKKLTINKVFIPKNLKPYDEVVGHWNTEDMGLVDKLTYVLSESHIDNALMSIKLQEEAEDNDEKFFPELFSPTLFTFPYEILIWLLIRKKNGLKNPTEFSHPLMNTSLCRSLLALEKPFVSANPLPFANELLTKLKDKIPDIDLIEA
jgi:hypothetical protein